MGKIRIGLIGVGGFGTQHLKRIKQFAEEGKAELKAVCNRNINSKQELLQRIGFGDVPQYNDIDSFLRAGEALDLVIIATPFSLHKTMCCEVLSAGYNVLVEKPPAVTVQDVREILEAEKHSAGFCAVGFQHTAEQSFVYLVNRLRQGAVGEILSIHASAAVYRCLAYFKRNSWAGKMMERGEYILDGTVNNQFSHLINNCLLVAGLRGKDCGAPEWVQAELYRANDIECEDTSSIRILTKGKVQIDFGSSLCCVTQEVPHLWIEGDDGTAYWDYDGKIEFYHKNAKEPFEAKCIRSDAETDMYNNIFDHISGKNEEVTCPLKLSENFVLASNLAFESSRMTHRIDARFITRTDVGGNPTVVIHGINHMIHRCVNEKKMFSECGVEWGVETKPAYAEGYRKFECYSPE